jgi:P27 family predicted phage terminase small subunit
MLQGNPGKRALNLTEPQPKKTQPKCPRWLNRFAREEWVRVVPELQRLGILTVADEKALACYCQAYGRLRLAEAIIASKGMTFTTPNGFVQKRPEVTIAREAMQLMKAFAAEFGLTPASRTRLHVSPASTSEEAAMAKRMFGG